MLPYKITIINLTIILSVITVMATPQSPRAQKSTRLVEAIEIEGNRRLSADDILSHIQTRPGIEYSQKQVQLDLKALLDWGVFDTTQTKVTVTEGLRGGILNNSNLERLN